MFFIGYALAFIINQRCHNHDQFCKKLCDIHLFLVIAPNRKRPLEWIKTRKLLEKWRKSTIVVIFTKFAKESKFIITGSLVINPPKTQRFFLPTHFFLYWLFQSMYLSTKTEIFRKRQQKLTKRKRREKERNSRPF